AGSSRSVSSLVDDGCDSPAEIARIRGIGLSLGARRWWRCIRHGVVQFSTAWSNSGGLGAIPAGRRAADRVGDTQRPVLSRIVTGAVWYEDPGFGLVSTPNTVGRRCSTPPRETRW